jgi:chromate reductase, NAD(P)H dehydrogenase (quinone)
MTLPGGIAFERPRVTRTGGEDDAGGGVVALSDNARVLLISGSTRNGSANTAALVTAAALAPERVTPVLYGGLADLPAFNPDHDGDLLPPVAAALRGEIAAAAAVLFCTPEYAGTLPGSLKNLLDWTVGGGEMYGKPAAWINVAAPGRGGGAAATLASVLAYVSADVIEAACRDVPVPRDAVTREGTVSDPGFAVAVAGIWTAVLGYLDAAS